MNGWQSRYTNIQSLPFNLKLDIAILGQSSLGDVQLGNNFDPGRKQCLHMLRQLLLHSELSIDPITDRHSLLVRLDMNIAGLQIRRRENHLINQLHYRRIG
ncbi:hypothetical protein D3C78_1124730 [compost metagenome]